MRRALVLAAALFAAACSSPRSPLEEAARTAVPSSARAFPGSGVEILPESAAARALSVRDAAAARGAVTLSDCVAMAEATSEDLLFAAEERLQSLLLRDEALALLLPEVRLRAGHARQDPSGSGPTSDSVRSQAALQVVQPLYTGLREIHAMRSLESTAEAQDALRADLRRRIGLSVARAFFLLAEAEAEIEAQEEALHLDEQRVEEIRARMEEGLARRTEVLLQESRRESTRSDLLAVRERRDRARVLLEALVGVPLDLPVDPDPPLGPPHGTRGELLAGALRLRQDLRAAELRVRAAREEVALAAAGNQPVVDLQGSLWLAKHNWPHPSDDVGWDLLLSADLPLFLGGAVEARVRRAESRVRQAELERSRVLRGIESEVDQALVGLGAGVARLDTLRANEAFARENLDLLQAEYRQGLARNLEVFTAQIQLQQATVNLRRQEYQSRLDRIEVLVAAGREDPLRSPAADPAATPSPDPTEKP